MSPDASGNPMEQIAAIAKAMGAAGAPKIGGARKPSKTRKASKASKVPAVGTKAQVWHGSAKHTSGGLEKKDLMKTKKGRIVSRKKHTAGKRALTRLRKAGYTAKKGKFSLFSKK